MRVAIVKPDFGFQGGFEFVMDRIASHLVDKRCDVTWLMVDGEAARRDFAARLSPCLLQRAPEFVNYLALVDAVRRLDAHRADLVISSQPPSFAVEHRHHLSVFYHHNRVFYDLDDAARRSRLVDPELHPHARDLVRSLDAPMLASVTHFLAGSETVRDRLIRYNGRREGVGLFHAGTGLDEVGRDAPAKQPWPLCVSRHEFPKRTELFVLAIKLMPDLFGISVGSGGRLGYVQRLDRKLTHDPGQSSGRADEWLSNPGWLQPLAEPTPGSNVHFAGRVTERELAAFYRDCSCVVAPAYLEDYGLTALEAMSFGRPVIVCNDGGHLTRLVVDGVNGLMVEPTPAAIAAAIRRIHDDLSWAAELGEAGRATASAFTWERAFAEFDAGIEGALG